MKFKELSSLATKEYYFSFNENVYKRVDEVAMSSPLGLALDFPAYFEKK